MRVQKEKLRIGKQLIGWETSEMSKHRTPSPDGLNFEKIQISDPLAGDQMV
ncbi:MAG TPA: hypothetical protein VI912_01090 [Candidatus Bilamarchaeaceae archaeon]|nr:hypothetical protein [Candidatus Bilamarchaeaceae archaeon]